MKSILGVSVVIVIIAHQEAAAFEMSLQAKITGSIVRGMLAAWQHGVKLYDAHA